MEIWTYMKWISKFRDLDVHFESTGTGMRTRDKFRDLDVHFESTGTYLKSRDKFGDRYSFQFVSLNEFSNCIRTPAFMCGSTVVYIYVLHFF